MTLAEILRRYPNASPSFIHANLDASDTGASTVMEPNTCDGALAKSEIQKGDNGRFLVRVTSIRKRLLDEDNLCEKFHVDLCRYIGAIQSDDPTKTKIEVFQRKVQAKEEEHTTVEIFQLSQE